jgi:predicted MFS family arabinose efflux permease
MRPLFIVVGLALVAVIVLWLVVPPRALRRHASKFDPD